MQNLITFYRLVHKILTKGHNCVVNLGKWTHNNPSLDLVKVYAYAKFDQNLSILSQDTQPKRNSDVNRGL